MSELPSDSTSETCVPQSETSDSKTETSDSKTETSVSAPTISRNRERSSLKSQPEPAMVVMETVQKLEAIGGDLWKLIKLDMDSKEEGKGLSETSGGRPVDWQTYLYIHVPLLHLPRRIAIACENDSEGLEHVYQTLREVKDNACEDKCKIASMALHMSDLKRDEVENCYYDAEVKFYRAVINVCDTMFTRFSALVNSEMLQSVLDKFMVAKTCFSFACLRSTLKIADVVIRNGRERVLISHVGSC